ncbi:MAG: hypothetical protein HY541_08380 [Deltaproteobacteria bacterium]|nr:hypothetical protein [Deltaproteobacteria bacterium]
MSHDARHSCSVCSPIPDSMQVETLHTPERLPEAVDKLEIIGGYTLDGQVRKCPACGAWFIYTHDHDSQSGVGYGYTDEGIYRTTATAAKERLEKALERAQKSLAEFTKSEPRDYYASMAESSAEEIKRIEKELKRFTS